MTWLGMSVLVWIHVDVGPVSGYVLSWGHSPALICNAPPPRPEALEGGDLAPAYAPGPVGPPTALSGRLSGSWGLGAVGLPGLACLCPHLPVTWAHPTGLVLVIMALSCAYVAFSQVTRVRGR